MPSFFYNMHFEHLDSDILSIILHIVAHSTSKTISSWRTSIPLLHVNQRWRSLACPLVYKTALIETADTDGCEPQNVVSNLPFVCAGQFHRWIRNLAIATSFEVDIVCFYSSLSTLLLQYGDRLYTTTSISQESDFWAEHGHDDAEIDGTVARLHGAVSKAMPNVRHLFLRSWEPEGVLERVFGMLADAYADQISTLDMGDMLSLPQPWAPAISLQHLDIGLANYTNMEAMLCASSASLVSLTLRNVPNDFLWKPCEFGCEYVPQTIEFPCLRKVNISFSPHNKNKPETLEPGYLLRFSKLEALDMAHISASTRFVDICVFPPSIRAATLKLTLTGLEAMLKRKYGVPEVNRLVVHVYPSRNPELGDAAANHKEGLVNKFIKRYHRAKETVLFFGGGHELFVKYNIAKLARLSTVYLDGCQDIRTVKITIENAPDLVFLSASVSPSTEFKEADIGGLPSNLEPFNTKIKELRLKLLVTSKETKEKILAFIECLVLRIHSLKRLKVDHHSVSKVDAIIQKHKGEYPHLKNVYISVFP